MAIRYILTYSELEYSKFKIYDISESDTLVIEDKDITLIDFISECVKNNKPYFIISKEELINLKEDLTYMINEHCKIGKNLFSISREFAKLETIVCEEFKISRQDLKKKTKLDKIVKARQFIFSMLYCDNYGSLANIAKVYNKDHATVLHSREVVSNIIETKCNKYFNKINRICSIYELDTKHLLYVK